VKRAPTFFFGSGPLGRRIWRAHVRWLCGKRKPDLVLAGGIEPEGRIAWELAAEFRTPYVVYTDAPELIEIGRRAGSSFSDEGREVLFGAQAVVVPNRASWLEAYRLGILPQRLQEMSPGVDLETFAPGKPRPETVRKWRGDSGPVVLCVTSTSPAFDVETVLRAFAVVHGHRKTARLILVTPDAPSALSSLGRELRLGDAVHHVESPSVPELADLYRVADVFVTAHREDRTAGIVTGAEVSLLEALASALPIAAAHSPAMQEWIDDDEVAVLVEPGAHAKLGKAIVDLLRTKDEQEPFAEAARRLAESRFDAAVRATEFREFLEVLYYRRLGLGDLRAATTVLEGSVRSVA
jgi:glycosyltransferase involved in cell wall biosynthesis